MVRSIYDAVEEVVVLHNLIKFQKTRGDFAVCLRRVENIQTIMLQASEYVFRLIDIIRKLLGFLKGLIPEENEAYHTVLQQKENTEKSDAAAVKGQFAALIRLMDEIYHVDRLRLAQPDVEVRRSLGGTPNSSSIARSKTSVDPSPSMPAPSKPPTR